MSDSKELNLVLVEDELIYSKMIMYQLSKINLEDREIFINHVSTLAELKDIKEFIQPEIILLDLGLPGSFGIETFETVHKLFPESSIIVLTGNQDTEIGPKLIKIGAQDFIHKTEVNQEFLNRAITFTVNRLNNLTFNKDVKSVYNLAFRNTPLPLAIYNRDTTEVIDTNIYCKKHDVLIDSNFWKIDLNDAFQKNKSQESLETGTPICLDYQHDEGIILYKRIIYRTNYT